MKKQLLFQKIVSMTMLLTLVAALIFSMGIMTDIFDTLHVHANKEHPEEVTVAGANIFYELQDFNRLLFSLCFFALLLSLSIFLTNTHKRRKYYISNFVATGLVSLSSIALSIWAIIGLLDCSAKFLSNVNFEELQMWHDLLPTYYRYNDSTFWFDISIAAYILVILASIALIGNAIWKFQLIKKENLLLQTGELRQTAQEVKSL